MKILQIDHARFGTVIVDNPVRFEDGLNMWISRNQAGKTTMLTFLEWMLYGPPPRRGVKDPEALKRWSPWGGGQPSGRLVVRPELKDWPSELLINARFSDYSVQVSDYRTQKTLVERVAVNKAGEWNLGQQLLNLSRESFRLSLLSLQGNLVDPLIKGNLRSILTSDLGALVENPDVATVDRILAMLENPMFSLGNGHARTMQEHKVGLVKELDILQIEKNQLSAQLGDFRDVLEQRDAIDEQLAQQERAIAGMDRQTAQLTMARNYYLVRVSKPTKETDSEFESWRTEHAEYFKINSELEREVDHAAGQVEAIDSQISRNQNEIRILEEKLRAQQSHVENSPDVASGLHTARRLGEIIASVESAYRELSQANDSAAAVQSKIPAKDRERYAELEKIYDSNKDSLTTVMEWQREHLAINDKMADLRQRQADLEIMSRTPITTGVMLGFGLIPFGVIMAMVGAKLPAGLSSLGWIIAGVIWVAAIMLIYPWWKQKAEHGPAANELKQVVAPALDECRNKLGELDRKRRRFLEVYNIDRLTWDKLVEHIMEYTQLDMQMREFSVSQRDKEVIKRRLEAAWREVGEVLPLAPVNVDMDWLRKQHDQTSSSLGELNSIRQLEARLEENRLEVERLQSDRSAQMATLTSKLSPLGFDNVETDMAGALARFRQVADRVRALRILDERQANYQQSTTSLAIDEESFEREWANLSAIDQTRIAQLSGTREGFESVCHRLQEVSDARRESESQRERLRREADNLRDELTRFGQIDREAERLNARLAEAERNMKLVNQWDQALQTTKRTMSALVTSASQEVAPEIDRALRSVLAEAPIGGLKDIRLGSNLELMLSVEGAPADIPQDEVWAYLSSGAQRQLALALRLAMSRTASGRTTLPLLLDEPLSDLDDERAEMVYRYIQRLSGQTQIILTSCHKQQYEWLANLTRSQQQMAAGASA